LLELWRFERGLPARMAQTSLPDMMAQLSSHAPDLVLAPSTVRELADSVAALDVRSPLGICLRRSLVRYYFLRRAGLPVAIHFGARFQETHDIAGHAWLTLDGKPYQEATENYQGFAVMYSYPLIET
jgi:hypothetical protein